MRISSQVGSLADARIGVPEGAGVGRGPDIKRAGSRQLKRILLIRKAYRYLLSGVHIMRRPNRLVGLLGEAERCLEWRLLGHHLWNNLLIAGCLTIECNNWNSLWGLIVRGLEPWLLSHLHTGNTRTEYFHQATCHSKAHQRIQAGQSKLRIYLVLTMSISINKECMQENPWT